MRIPLAIVLLAGAGVAQAAEPAWTYGEFRYTRYDSSEDSAQGFDTEQADFGVAGSVGFSEIGHFRFDYRSGEVEEFGPAGGGDVDYDGFQLYLGAHPGINETTDLVAEFFYFEDTFEDFDGANDQDCDGYGLRTGLRSLFLSDKLELNLYGSWADGNCEVEGGGPEEDFTEFTLEVGGQYLWTPRVATGAVFTSDDPRARDGDDSVNFFLRYSFAADWF